MHIIFNYDGLFKILVIKNGDSRARAPSLHEYTNVILDFLQMSPLDFNVGADPYTFNCKFFC